MALVICDMSISLDGYVTGPNDSRENPTTSHPSVYTFVTDGVASAIVQAKNAAGDKVVGLRTHPGPGDPGRDPHGYRVVR